MGKRFELNNELLKFVANTYFQPPSNIIMSYPCVVYHKTGKNRQFANNGIYLTEQEYQLTVIEKNPDSDIADNIESHFQSCLISQYYTMDNLNHTSLTLYY